MWSISEERYMHSAVKFFTLHIPVCSEVGVRAQFSAQISYDPAALELTGLRAMLKGLRVAAWWCWDLNLQPSGSVAQSHQCHFRKYG